jgi:hypothetical protein
MIRMSSRLVTEIVSFRSLHELTSMIATEISYYLSRREEYSEQLGNFLREAEEKYGDEDWFKQLSLDRLGKGGGKQKKKKGEKKKKGKKEGEPEGWVSFKSMLFSSSVQGEAEIMFDAIESVAAKLEELENAKESMDDLKNVGLGNDVEYICFLKDGVVKKIVIKSTEAAEAEKFKFAIGLTAVKDIQPML